MTRYIPDEENEEIREYPMSDAIDHDILMHRETHFGGKFEFMLDYYQKGGKGIVPDFPYERICALDDWEKNAGQNLAVLLLTGSEAERISKARDTYKQLRSLYEKPGESNLLPRLIADLILSEEEEPLAEIAAIVAEKHRIVPLLTDLIRSTDFHDPLFPGYGTAPGLALRCLGMIGDRRAIAVLFESLGESDFSEESEALQALRMIGEPAKDFLLKIVHSKPFTSDNEQAAVALGAFKDDPHVAQTCLDLLSELDLQQHQLFATYLALVCEGLETEGEQNRFRKLAEQPTTPLMLRQDMRLVAKSWKG